MHKFRKYFLRVPGTLKRHLKEKRARFFLTFRLYLLESIRTCTTTTNNYFSYKINSTRWNLESTKSYVVISGKSLVMYNIYPPEDNQFWRGRVNSNFLGKIHQIQLSNVPKLRIFSETSIPNQL